MKLTRYNGHVPLFSQDMQGRERTLFGSTVQDDDINNQFTPEFLRGWGSVGSTEFPTLQDFNALAYTHNKLLSYLYQAGIPSYTENEEYYIGSIVQYNKDIYICLRDKPTVLPTDTNAWKRLQESLTFVGDGPEVMKKGAFGIGSINSPQIDNNVLLKNISNSICRVGASYPHAPSWGTTGSAIFRMGWGETYFNVLYLSPIARRYAIKSVSSDVDRGWDELYTTANTRKDKNNVLHAGTSTPINTLNVSDMLQEVIDNDLLTVTSGAVYRALLLKANLTYVNTELGKKADKTYVDSELLKKADLTYVDTELDKKITGGDVVQTTGQSTVDVMSQKGATDAINSVKTTANKVARGWRKDPNTGLIEQWGTESISDHKTTIKFPISFTKSPFFIMTNHFKNNGFGNSDTVNISSRDNIQFVAQIRTPNNSSLDGSFDWYAIGE